MENDGPGEAATREVTPASVLQLGMDTVVFRPIQPDDGPRMRASLPLLSEESRVRRFFFDKRGFGAGELDQLTHCDGVHQCAYVALVQRPETDTPLVAVGRWIRTTADVTAAEVAYVTRDDWQRRGLGRNLIRLLAAEAQRRGVTHFDAHVLIGNSAAIKLLETVGTLETKKRFSDTAWQLRYRLRA